MLVRLASLAVSNAVAAPRLSSMGDRDKDIEILALRRDISVLQWQLGASRPRFEPANRALLAASLTRLSREKLRGPWLMARPDTRITTGNKVSQDPEGCGAPSRIPRV